MNVIYEIQPSIFTFAQNNSPSESLMNAISLEISTEVSNESLTDGVFGSSVHIRDK